MAVMRTRGRSWSRGQDTGVSVIHQCDLGLGTGRVVVSELGGSGVILLEGAVGGGLDWRRGPGWGCGSRWRLPSECGRG